MSQIRRHIGVKPVTGRVLRARVAYRFLHLVLVNGLFLLLAGCQLTMPTPYVLSTHVSPVTPFLTPQDSLATSTHTSNTPAPTSVIASGSQGGNPTGVPASPMATVAPDPLRLVFPTPGLAPVSAWRPPLYPTPWAPTPYDHFYFARPIAADEVNWPLADYRYGGEFFADVVHTGVDIPAPKGSPVLAAGPGKVIWAGYGVYRGGFDTTDPYGLAVTIRHDFGYQGQALYTVYGHLDQIDVAEGQHVETGDVLGLVGETGRVTGPHLHFEVRLDTNSFFTTRNPELWLAPPQGWGVLAGRVMDTGGVLVSGQLIIVHNPKTGQNWFARSYENEAVNSDPYYRENLVVGDLPAGEYLLRTAYAGYSHTLEVEILPGLVNYFTFRGWDSFELALPPTPGAEFTLPEETSTAP